MISMFAMNISSHRSVQSSAHKSAHSHCTPTDDKQEPFSLQSFLNRTIPSLGAFGFAISKTHTVGNPVCSPINVGIVCIYVILCCERLLALPVKNIINSKWNGSALELLCDVDIPVHTLIEIASYIRGYGNIIQSGWQFPIFLFTKCCWYGKIDGELASLDIKCRNPRTLNPV